MNKLIENNAQMMYEVCLALDVFEKNTKVIVFKEWRCIGDTISRP